MGRSLARLVELHLFECCFDFESSTISDKVLSRLSLFKNHPSTWQGKVSVIPAESNKLVRLNEEKMFVTVMDKVV